MDKKFLIILVVVLIFLLVWAPWITKDYAERKVSQAFNEKWYYGVSDGCSLVRVISSQKIPLGYSVKIEYVCGLLPPAPFDYEGFSKSDEILVSFLGTVHGL